MNKFFIIIMFSLILLSPNIFAETVDIQINSTGNAWSDSYIKDEGSADTIHDSTNPTFLEIRALNNVNTFLMPNLTQPQQIPTGCTVTFAKVCLYNTNAESDNVHIHEINVSETGSWEEESLTFNNNPAGTSFNIFEVYNATQEDIQSTGAGWTCWENTGMIAKAVVLVQNNASMILRPTAGVSEMQFASKEHGTPSQHWFQNVTCILLGEDIQPPFINQTNITSEGGLGQLVNLSDPFCHGIGCVLPKINDTTPQVRVTTNETATCAFINDNRNLNYTDMIEYNPSSKCSTTGSTEHTCTLTEDNATTTGLHNYSTGCKDSNGNENLTGFMFTINISNPTEGVPRANITLLLNGQNNTRRYENPVRIDIGGTINVIARVVNITIQINEEARTCITIDNQINISCSTGNWSYYLNVTELRQDKILNKSLSVNMSGGISNISIESDKYSDVLFFTINLTGYELESEYPVGIEIDIDQDNKSDVVLPGKLRGNVVETNTFLADNINRSGYNITFQTGGSITILINVTSESNILNFSLEVSGNDLDVDNEVSLIEHFNGTDGTFGFNDTLTYHADAPLGVFDEFAADNSKWSLTKSGSCEPSFDYQSSSLLISLNASGAFSCTADIDYNDLVADMRNTSLITLIFRDAVTCSDSGDGKITIYATDGTSKVELDVESRGVCPPEEDEVRNLTLIKQSDDYKTWIVTGNVSETGNKDLSSLDFDKQIKLSFHLTASGGNPGIGKAILELLELNWGGVWLNRSKNNGTYKSGGNITSNVINVTKTNISRAIITSVAEYKPTGTDIIYYLSNTCNYTKPIFESVTPGVIHTFDTVGNELCWRANLNSSVNISSPVVRKLTIEIIKGSLENVSADLGSNGIIDWIFPDILNSTTSPRVVNGSLSGFVNYRAENCLNSLVCEYPITFSSLTGGTLGITKANTTVSISDINFNISKVQNKSIINISFSFKKGLLELLGINLNFRGQKNFTINATHSDNITFLKNKESQIVWFRFSKFNWSLPYTFTRTIVPYGIRTVNSTNVTPFGQTETIPIINLTNQAQNEFNIGLKMNQTFDCLEVKVLNSSNTSKIGIYGINLTTSTQNFGGNLTMIKGMGLWLFYDLYDCDPSAMRFLQPRLEYESCCEQCVRCW